MATILLVDDEPEIVESYRQLLELRGYTVLSATSAEAALAVCAQSQEPIDVLLSDIALSHVDGGIQLAAAMKAQNPSLVVILMSGLPDLDYPDCAVADGTLQKPFRAGDLFEAIKNACTLALSRKKV